MENGGMEIALGSHRAGKIPADRAAEVAASYEHELTLANPGDVLILAMLTLHRSVPATSQTPTNRRVLRIDYATQDLPSPLSWAS